MPDQRHGRALHDSSDKARLLREQSPELVRREKREVDVASGCFADRAHTTPKLPQIGIADHEHVNVAARVSGAVDPRAMEYRGKYAWSVESLSQFLLDADRPPQ
jgi:hypothetical protein